MNKLINTLSTDQQRAIANIREAATRIWERPLHRYYTDHSVAHSERVIALLDGLTTGLMRGPRPLSPGEVFVLLAAAYLHDVGMQNERFAGGNLDTIRAQHNEQTAEMIYAVFEDPAHAFHIPLARDPGVVEAVALVARGHRRVDLAGAEYDSLVHGAETLRLRLLAALLRFGDELDIDHRRVDLEQIKLLKLEPDSQLHWYKCYYVGGVSVEDEYIRVSYRFPQERPDYEGLIVPLVEDEIRDKLADLRDIFRAEGVKVDLGPPQVRLMRLVSLLPEEVEQEIGKWGSREVEKRETIVPGEKRSGSREVGVDKAPASSFAPARPGGGERGSSATLHGSGAIAQGRSGAATSGGTVVMGNVGGDVVSGNKTVGIDQRGAHIGTQINVSGDYVEGRSPGSAPTGAPTWNRAALRDLLTSALDDQELTGLCFDHFDPVYQIFSDGMKKSAKVQALLDYCIRQERVGELLDLVRRRNPAQYAQFERRLKS